jgi:alpha-beta hydrolase superfamily lysophospholipase
VQTPALMLKPAQPNGGCVCWVHGSGDGKAQFKWTLLRALTRRGFAVFTFDLPGHDEHPTPFSLPEALTAVPAALSYLAQRPDLDRERIGLMGVSLGGALAIRALAEASASGSGVPLPKAVCLLETPCALRPGSWVYVLETLGMTTLQALDVFRDTSSANLLRLYLTHPRPKLAEPVEWVFDDLCPARYVAEMPSVPLLIVSGTRDPIARRWHGERLYERAKEPKAWHIVRFASHFSLTFLAETARLVGDWFGVRLTYHSPS